MKHLSDYGVIGDGVADDTAAVQAAFSGLVEGDTLEITPGTYKIDGNVLISTSLVTITGRGLLLKDPLSGVKPMIVLADFVDHVTFDGIAFDGSRPAFANGAGVPAILGHRNSHIHVIDCIFKNLIDVGVKLRNAYALRVSNSVFEDIGENGVETRVYAVDPRTGQPWVGGHLPIYGGHRVFENLFERIGRFEGPNTGLVDGCAYTVDRIPGAPEVNGVSFENNDVFDCLRAFFSENHGEPMRGVRVTGNHMEGRLAAPSVYVKCAVGIINVDGFLVGGNTVLNWGNAEYHESYTAAVALSGNSRHGKVTDNNIQERRTSGARMQYGIKATQCSEVEVSGNNIHGATVAAIDIEQYSSLLSVFNNPGADNEQSWSDTFEVEYYLDTLAAGQNGAPLKPSGWNTDPNTAVTSRCAMVGVSYRLTAPITAGTFSIAPYVNGQSISTMLVNDGSFGGGQYAGRKVALNNAPMVDNLAGLAVRYTTNAAFAGGGGLFVKLVFDRSRKQ